MAGIITLNSEVVIEINNSIVLSLKAEGYLLFQNIFFLLRDNQSNYCFFSNYF